MIENFTKYASNPVITASQAWEGGAIIETSAINESGTFKMWYRGSGGIGYATSTDGIAWTKYASNPVIANGGGYTIELICVLKIGSTYYIYGNRHTSLTDYYLYRWSSSDGITWNLDNSGSPVLQYDAGEPWESYAIYNPSVLYDPTDTGKEYKLLYEAAGWNDGNGFQIGYAYSTDGLSFTKSTSNPVLPKSGTTWKSAWTGNPCLIKIGTYYYAIYGGADGSHWKIGLSRSTDMVTWEDALNNPIIESTESYENGQCADPDIIYDVTGKTYKVYLYYGSDQSTISLATLTNQNLEDYFNDPDVFPAALTFPTDWNYRCAITIDHTKVLSDQTDYPILISYNIVGSEANIPGEVLLTGGTYACQTDGGDIRFTSDLDGTTQLACEIEKLTQNDPISGASTKIWVKCNISSTVDTIIYMWWGTNQTAYQPDSTDTYGKYSVWSKFDEVWHMGENASPNVNSKKSNSLTWGGSGNAQGSGKLGNSLGFNGSGYASANSHSGYASTSDHTISFWAKLNNPAGTGIAMMFNNMGAEGSGVGEAASIRIDNNWQQFYSTGAYTAWAGNVTLSSSTWYYFVYTITAGTPATLKIYYNGNLQTFGQQSGTLSWTAGSALYISGDLAHDYMFSGNIQEIRYAPSVLDADYINTEYNNQNNPDTFISDVGAIVEVNLAPTPTARRREPVGYNTLASYIRDVRSRIDDDPVGGVLPYYSDSQLTIFINNARRKISIDLRAYLLQMYVIPSLNIDEYSLPKNYLQSTVLVDIKNQRTIPPINQANAEMTKLMYDSLINYGNFAFINPTRKKLTFNIPMPTSMVEPTYTIQAFSRIGNVVNVNAVSSGTFADIAKWDSVKGYIKITQTATENVEYVRYSKIEADTTANTYTIYVSAFDLNKQYKNDIEVYGTVAISSTNSTIYGTSTKFTVDLATADKVSVGSAVRQISSVTSDTVAVVNSAFTVTSSGNTMYVDNMNEYTTGDTLQFISYVMNYFGLAKELELMNEECGFDYHIQQLVPTLAASEAYLRQSRKQEALTELNEYNQESQKIFTRINQMNADLHNRGQIY